MKNRWFIFLFATMAFSLNIYATDSEPKPAQIEWFTNYDEALEYSKVTNKPLILLFTGSDWCSWCQKLDREVLQQSEFAEMCADKFVFVMVDFPHSHDLPPAQEHQNLGLKNMYGVRGFPKMVIVDEKQQKVVYINYRRGGPKKHAERLLNALNDK